MNDNKEALVSLAYVSRGKEYALAMLESYGVSDTEAKLSEIMGSANAVVTDSWQVQPCY